MSKDDGYWWEDGVVFIVSPEMLRQQLDRQADDFAYICRCIAAERRRKHFRVIEGGRHDAQ